MKDVSIIIVNYNTETLLDDTLRSVREQVTDIDYETIVVDNASDEGSLNALVEKYPEVNFHFSTQNLGFGRANNLGVTKACGKYLFFLNPDTFLINNVVKILYDYMEAHPEAGICGGNMYDAKKEPLSSYYDIEFLRYEYKIIFNSERPVGFNHTKEVKEVNVIVGADLFMMKELFEKQGGFDPDFFMYFEEVELCNRVQKAGYKIMSVPQAELYHYQGATAENKNEELKKWSYQEHWYSKLVYFSKTKGKFQTRTVYSATMLKLKLALFVHTIKGATEKKIYWRQKRNVLRSTFGRYKNYLETKKQSKTHN